MRTNLIAVMLLLLVVDVANGQLESRTLKGHTGGRAYPIVPVLAKHTRAERLDALSMSHQNMAWITNHNAQYKKSGTNEGQVGCFVHYQRQNTFPCNSRVFQISDGTNMIVDVEGHGQIWVSGIDTSGHSDGDQFIWTETVERTGNKEYATTGGSKRTLPMYSVTDDSKQVLELALALRSGKIKHKSLYGDWQTKDGSSVSGRMVSFAKGVLTIDVDGKNVELKGSTLSKDCKKRAAKLRSAAKKRTLANDQKTP